MEYPIILISAITLLSAGFLSFILIYILLKSKKVDYFCDHPGRRKVHQRIVPRIGGIAIVISFLILMTLWKLLLNDYIPVIDPMLYNAIYFAAICIFIIGLIDDIYILNIQNKAKFFMEIIIALEIIYIYKIHFSDITINGHSYTLKIVGIIISVIYIVGVTNAANIIDGIDGLAGGVFIISYISTAILSANIGSWGIVIICLIIVGAISGFLYFNKAPARIFLGDSGSLFLGLILSIIIIYLTTLSAEESLKSRASYLVAFLIVGFPILDVTVAMGRRFVRSILTGDTFLHSLKNMTVADNEHIHHRLLYHGLSHTQTSAILYFLNTTFCISAILISRINIHYGLAVLFYIIFIATTFLYQLNFFDRIITILNTKIQRKKTGMCRTDIGIINADPVLHHGLKSFKQDVFDFNFLPLKKALSIKLEYPVIVFACSKENSAEDLNNAKTVLDIQNCQMLFISDYPDNYKIQSETTAISRMYYANKPTYIPKLLEDIYEIINLNKTCQNVTSD
jgi:UDP-GlcNAc:undecaprenyl-phosphate/decaprenyl-phosphate GlcNAc-1-phosphate transferase